MRRLAIATGLALGVLGASASAEIINLPVSGPLNHAVEFQAGTWVITPVKEPEQNSGTPGADYTAYNVWGFSGGCTDGLSCTNGYRWAYELVDVDDNVISSFNTSSSGLPYGNTQTAILAFEIAQQAGPFTFTLDTAQTLWFVFSDSQYTDNRGGVSLDLSLQQTPPPNGVPTPGTALLLGLGLAALARRLTSTPSRPHA